MFYIASTRFNNLTWNENIQYRNKSGETVIYGNHIKIRNIYPLGSLLFVIEMNNELNRVEGIGLIKNSLVHDKRHKIYDNAEYNRYIYRGDYWISRNEISQLDMEIIDICDLILFKGKSHLKRQSGISVVTDKLFTNWKFEQRYLKNKIKRLFIYKFQHNATTSTGENDRHISLLEQEEN